MSDDNSVGFDWYVGSIVVAFVLWVVGHWTGMPLWLIATLGWFVVAMLVPLVLVLVILGAVWAAWN